MSVNILTPEMLRLVAIVETNLHFIAKQDFTRDQAIEIRRRLIMPLGAMGTRYNLARRHTKTLVIDKPQQST